MNIKDILIYFAIHYEGDYSKILDAIKRREKVNGDEVDQVVQSLSCQTLTILDENYPYYFKEIYRPPFVLFYHGDISLLESPLRLSVVGTRNPSIYGQESTYTLLSNLLEKENVLITSGLAKGIDKIAHEVALESNRKTIAILANGIDYCYPEENLDLYEEIKEKGLILSEYPNALKPKREQFGQRNRLISALSPTLFVPEARMKSGTSITVHWAIEQNKNVLCM